jgi:hypothetical protein
MKSMQETDQVHEREHPLLGEDAVPGQSRASAILDNGVLVEEVAVRKDRIGDDGEAHDDGDVLTITDIELMCEGNDGTMLTRLRPQIAHVRPRRTMFVTDDSRERRAPTLMASSVKLTSKTWPELQGVQWTQIVALILSEAAEEHGQRSDDRTKANVSRVRSEHCIRVRRRDYGPSKDEEDASVGRAPPLLLPLVHAQLAATDESVDERDRWRGTRN